MVLDVGGGAVEEDAIDSDGAGGLAGVGGAAEAGVAEGVGVGDVWVEGDGRSGGMDEEGGCGRHGDEDKEEQEGGAAHGWAPAGVGALSG